MGLVEVLEQSLQADALPDFLSRRILKSSSDFSIRHLEQNLKPIFGIDVLFVHALQADLKPSKDVIFF
jgi:hypothetical protein